MLITISCFVLFSALFADGLRLRLNTWERGWGKPGKPRGEN